MKRINSTADLCNWPAPFKLGLARTRLQGPARNNWYLGRISIAGIFIDWKNVVRQFQETFIGTPA